MKSMSPKIISEINTTVQDSKHNGISEPCGIFSLTPNSVKSKQLEQAAAGRCAKSMKIVRRPL